MVVEDGLLTSFAPETSRSIVRNGLASLMATASCMISRLIISLSVERLTFMVSMYSWERVTRLCKSKSGVRRTEPWRPFGVTLARMGECRVSSRSLSKSFDGISKSREREDVAARGVAGMGFSSTCASVTESLVFVEGPVHVVDFVGDWARLQGRRECERRVTGRVTVAGDSKAGRVEKR